MDLLIGDMFTNAARAVPGRMAATLGQESLTFGQIETAANRTARALAGLGLGLGLGARMVTWTGTTLDAIPLFAAAAKLGVVFAPANAQLSTAEAVAMASAAKPAVLVVDEPRAEAGVEVADKLGVPLVTIAGLAAMARGGAAVGSGAGPAIRLAEQAAGADDSRVVTPELTERHPHVLFFTSGSTGRSKGVILSHRVNFLRTHPGAQLEPRGVMVSSYPLFHMGAWTLALQQWQARDGLVMTESADAASICAAITRHRASRINAIPAVWGRILDHLDSPQGKGHDLSTLRFADSGTSATPLELLERIEAAAPNACIRVFYGSTESGNVASLEHADLRRKPGSCGTPSHCVEVRLDDGELLVRTPVLFDGYFDNPEATEAALDGDWYRTGDLATVDDEGYLSIVGRAGDLIRSGGESVAPSEVEAVLAELGGLRDLAVVGIPDDRWGQVVCAVLVLDTGVDAPTVEEIRQHCQGRLASFKHPRRVEVVEAIPRTASTNQVQRRQLVQRIASGD